MLNSENQEDLSAVKYSSSEDGEGGNNHTVNRNNRIVVSKMTLSSTGGAGGLSLSKRIDTANIADEDDEVADPHRVPHYNAELTVIKDLRESFTDKEEI